MSGDRLCKWCGVIFAGHALRKYCSEKCKNDRESKERTESGRGAAAQAKYRERWRDKCREKYKVRNRQNYAVLKVSHDAHAAWRERMKRYETKENKRAKQRNSERDRIMAIILAPIHQPPQA